MGSELLDAILSTAETLTYRELNLSYLNLCWQFSLLLPLFAAPLRLVYRVLFN
jgi:hypothetical protein